MKHVLIVGDCAPAADPQALEALARSVIEIRPDEIVCARGTVALMELIRSIYAGPVGVHRGIALDYEATHLPEVHDIAPGWISTGGYRDDHKSSIAGSTALKAAKRFNKSVALGHTRKLGLISHTSGSLTLTGMEVGTLGDTSGREGWQQGFGLLAVEGKHVTATPVPITQGRQIMAGAI